MLFIFTVSLVTVSALCHRFAFSLPFFKVLSFSPFICLAILEKAEKAYFYSSFFNVIYVAFDHDFRLLLSNTYDQSVCTDFHTFNTLLISVALWQLMAFFFSSRWLNAHLMFQSLSNRFIVFYHFITIFILLRIITVQSVHLKITKFIFLSSFCSATL